MKIKITGLLFLACMTFLINGCDTDAEALEILKPKNIRRTIL